MDFITSAPVDHGHRPGGRAPHLLEDPGRAVPAVGPNQALIVYGMGHPKVVKGGGAIVWPMVQSADELSLELMSFDVAPQQDLYTQQGVAVTVEAVAQIKVKSDPESIMTAAEQFLRKTPAERENLIRLSMEGHLRGIVGQLTVEEIVKQPEMVAGRMRENVAGDMDKMGLEVISFTIKDVKDKNEYIANMGRPDIARVKRNADIATAEAARDTAIREAETMRESAIARAAADQERVIAEMASQTRQAEAERDLALKRAEYERSVKTSQAQADKAYEIQANVMQQQIVAEEVGVERVKREEQIKVQEAEILRRERELEATVLKAAEAEKRRIEIQAEAERQRRMLEAQGVAEANRAEGAARADVTRLEGQAEADIIRAKGEAEAGAMEVRANAFKEYNQAACSTRCSARCRSWRGRSPSRSRRSTRSRSSRTAATARRRSRRQPDHGRRDPDDRAGAGPLRVADRAEGLGPDVAGAGPGRSRPAGDAERGAAERRRHAERRRGGWQHGRASVS